MSTTDEALTEQIARALAYDCEGTGVDVPDPDSDLWCVTHDIGMDNGEWCQAIDYAAAAVLPIIRKAQADAWEEGMRYAIECGNETSDSFGNLYRIDWINRMEHEIEECRKYEIEKEQTNG